MIEATYLYIDSKYYKPIDNLTSTPIPGKRIIVNKKFLTIRCALRYVDEKRTSLHIDLFAEKNNEK